METFPVAGYCDPKFKKIESIFSESKKEEYYTHGSQTKKNEPELADKLEMSNQLNIDYLTEKWGADWRVQGPTYLPWEGDSMENNPRGDTRRISTTTFDLDFVRSKHLGF